MRPRVYKHGNGWEIRYGERLVGHFRTLPKAHDHARRMARTRAHVALADTLSRAAAAHERMENNR